MDRRMNFNVTFCTLVAYFLLCGCKDDVEEVVKYNDIKQGMESPFVADKISFAQLPPSDAQYIFRLDESSTEITNPNKYSFKTNELIQLREEGEKVLITSYSAKTIHDVDLEIYLPEIGKYVVAAKIDSIPGFSRFSFKPSIIGTRRDIDLEDGRYASVEYPQLDFRRMKPRLVSNDDHFKKLQKIEAQWQISFSNYNWTPGTENGNWKEMRPIFAREWVVIVTNFAYMMTTEEFKFAMTHFKEIFGGDLTDNDSVSFSQEKYLAEIERFKAPKVFKLGRSGDSVGGLGGGSTWGISDWNYYGHYLSYSGWESITHEYAHCMGYSHNSNMTYAKSGIGWTVFIWQLHLWLSYQTKDLPYLDRKLLDFAADDKAQYRDNIGVADKFTNETTINNNRTNYFNNPNQKLIKYFKEKRL